MEIKHFDDLIHLKRQPDAHRAQSLLRRLALQVQPLMGRYTWRVKILREFLPSQANLLGVNVNRGLEIRLRLRRHTSPSEFLSFEEVLGTLLHELTHMVHGPHNDAFYRFLTKLENEMDQLMVNGHIVSEDGFIGQGHKLSSSSTTSQNQPINRSIIATAAEKRRNWSAIKLPAGGVRLGGSTPVSCLTAREMAVLAAERRLKDRTWCGSDESEQLGAQNKKREIEVIYLDDDEEEVKSAEERQVPAWPCPQCTYLNHALALQCSICLFIKQKSR